MPLTQSPSHTPPAAGSGGDKEDEAAKTCMAPERTSRVRSCPSLRSASGATADPDTSAATSEVVGGDGEAECSDVENQIVSGTQDHALLLPRLSSSISITGSASSLLRRHLSSFFSGGGSTRTAARGDASSSMAAPDRTSSSSQEATTANSEVDGKPLERPLGYSINSTAAGDSALAPSRSSVQGRSVSSVSHRLYRAYSLFWADATASLASPSTLLWGPTRTASAPLPLSSSTRVGHEDAPDASIEAVVAHVEAEDCSELTRATAAASSVPRARKAARDGGTDAIPHPRIASVEQNGCSTFTEVTAKQSPMLSMRGAADSSSALAFGCTPPEDVFRREAVAQHVGEDESSSSNLRFFSSTATPGMHHALYAVPGAEQHRFPSESADDAGDSHHSRGCSSDSKPRDASRKYVAKERRPGRYQSNDFHGAARSRSGDVECITMSSLVAHVAVPPTVQAVLRNSDATKEELWMALRTACQQCEVLQRRLARAEGALGNEEEVEWTEGEVGATAEGGALAHVTAHRRRSGNAGRTSRRPWRRHADDEERTAPNAGGAVEGVSEGEKSIASEQADSGQMRSSTAPPTPTRTDRQVHPGHRARRRIAELAAASSSGAAAAVASSTPPFLVSALPDGSTNAADLDPHSGRGGGTGDASSVLRHRVSEAIRRVEAKRNGPLRSPHALQSPETHTRPNSSGLDGPTSSHDADDTTQNSSDHLRLSLSPPPQPEAHGNSHSTSSSDLQASGARHVRVEDDAPPTLAPTPGLTAHDPLSPTRIESGSSSSGSDAGAAPLHASRNEVVDSGGETAGPGESGILVSPTLPAITEVQAKAPVAQDSYNSAERVRLVQSPQQQLHRRHRGASLVSLYSAPAALDESVHFNGPATAAESLATLQTAAAFKPASWPSNGLQSSYSGGRSAGFHSRSPLAFGSPTLPNTTQHRSGWTASTGANGASTAVIASHVTPLSGTPPSLHSSALFGLPAPPRSPLRSESSMSSVEPAWLRQQQQQQHATAKATPSRAAAAARISAEASQQGSLSSTRSCSPNKAALSAASATLEMLRQLQQEDAPVPPVTGDDQKAALRQWRREAAVKKGSGTAPMC
ncbi:hypothetical protein conserved [Leishmania donovani]|uniref:Uncharacterized protein n=3 Tax=Leishmania donovani species complex TaxID=38574 RepID=E9AGA9_LEIIN|nr:hypothetical protein, unknown function [Leishmania infantum JPCM5]CAC9462554.1 hypothetical_protein_-_conserved [Leishmania infantum]CAJ1986987.1 hypothetical protein conserved [Leishmania donovani]CBZ08409.1 hypothetical protein, unknown function [Leishmania infantum JPCM5]SUZ39943.1 hypothetical_protein_-_conserved [Leishmania infantum]|eukprot:XP_003392261.1 hypothetical protein, unknown function [Leishmania infantum JPCM5]